jgi:hypothetical protein
MQEQFSWEIGFRAEQRPVDRRWKILPPAGNPRNNPLSRHSPELQSGGAHFGTLIHVKISNSGRLAKRLGQLFCGQQFSL